MYSTGQVVGQPLLAAAGCAAAALATAARAGAWQLSDDQVQDAIALTLVAESRLAALRAGLLAEADLRGLRDRTRSTSTEGWLADRYRLSTADARSRVEQADRLARHPALAGALTEGAVSVEQAEVIAHTLDQVHDLPLVEECERQQAAELLLEQAGALVPRELARAGQQIVQHLTRTPTVDDPAEADQIAREQRRADEEAEAAARDRATWRHRLRPGRRGRATLDTGPLGDALIKAWEHHAARPHPGSDGFEDTRTRDQRLGQALLDLLAADLGHPHLSTDQTGEPLFDGDTGDTGETDQPSRGPGPISARAVLAVTVTLEGLRAALAGTGTSGGMLDTGVALTPAELRLLACDAGIIPAVLGSPAQVLDLGRATSTWNLAQRRALAIRDRGCIAPGCDRAPVSCQAHHRTRWADDGPTDLTNGALLCSFHHHQVHRQNWHVVLAANGYPALIPPTTIDPHQRPRQHHRYRLQLLTTKRRT